MKVEVQTKVTPPKILRHPDGTLKVPLTNEQQNENIAIHFPPLAKTCYREIARADALTTM